MKKNNDFQIFSNGLIIFRGITYNTKSKQGVKNFNKKVFIQTWNSRFEEIKKQKFDLSQIIASHDDFIHELLSFNAFLQENMQELSELHTEMNFALRIAHSNYRDSKKGLTGFLIGLFTNKALDKLSIPNFPLIGGEK